MRRKDLVVHIPHPHGRMILPDLVYNPEQLLLLVLIPHVNVYELVYGLLADADTLIEVVQTTT